MANAGVMLHSNALVDLLGIGAGISYPAYVRDASLMLSTLG